MFRVDTDKCSLSAFACDCFKLFCSRRWGSCSMFSSNPAADTIRLTTRSLPMTIHSLQLTTHSQSVSAHTPQLADEYKQLTARSPPLTTLGSQLTNDTSQRTKDTSQLVVTAPSHAALLKLGTSSNTAKEHAARMLTVQLTAVCSAKRPQHCNSLIVSSTSSRMQTQVTEQTPFAFDTC